MEQKEKVRLLKSLTVLNHLPEGEFDTLAGFLKVLLVDEQKTVFEEGSRGDSLYFLASGQVRIWRRMPDGDEKDLAILGPGEVFGEMALLTESVARSANATTVGPSVLFQLERADLKAWLEVHPQLAVEFFNGLLQVQSARLRRASREGALLFELSHLLIAPPATSKDFLARTLDQFLWYLGGSWTGGAFLLDAQGQRREQIAQRGEPPAPLRGAPKVPVVPAERKTGWTDRYTYHIFLPEGQGCAAYLLLSNAAGVSPEERQEADRVLGTAARLLALVFKKEPAARA